MPSGIDAWADVYDAIYSSVRGDIPFYVDTAVESRGTVLELGCGTGRVTVPIAEARVDIVGLDLSEAMLAAARRKTKGLPAGSGSVTLVQGDMADFTLADEKRFGLAIIPFRGILHLLTVDAQVRALQSIKRHLEPGGRLVFNVFVPDPATLAEEGGLPTPLPDSTDPDTGARFVRWLQSSYDNHNQLWTARVTAEEVDADGNMVRRLHRDFQVRYVHRWEMHHLLEMCGFEVVDLYGDFDRSPFDETSTEMVWVAAARK